MAISKDKTYIACIKEISAEDLYEGLLANGLFSEKMPPVFTSKPFFDFSLSTSQPFSDTPHQFIYYEHMRNFNKPRPLGIPNPFGYQRLCQCLQENWMKIIEHFKEQTKGDAFKTSRIHIRKLTDKSTLFEMNYDNWKTDGSPEIDLLVGKSWVVKADISNCFPSMYSHSLPWALVGKPIAKETSKKKTWFNDIDHFTQNLKNGETHGFIIGPHVSNLLAEIILTTIDHELRKNWDYTRRIDDYTCYVDTYEKTELFLSALNKQLRHYDLLLNHNKTEILELPIASGEHWRWKIFSINLTRKIKNDEGEEIEIVDFNHTRLFMDTIIELMENNDMNAAILNYALQILVSHELTSSAKNYCIKTIMHYALIFPYLVPLLDKFLFIPLKVKKEDIKRYSNQIFTASLKINHYEGLGYAIYFALKYNFTLETITSEIAIASEDCVFMLLSYLYYKKKEDKKAIQSLRRHAKTLASNKDDFDRYWLFNYEILSQSELKHEWKPMKKAGVTFLKNEAIF